MGSFFDWAATSGNFGVAANWYDQSDPASSGTITPGTTDTVEFTSEVAAGSDITGGGSVAILLVEGDITFDATITAASANISGSLAVRSGSLAGNGELTVSGTLIGSGGAIDAANITDTGTIALATCSLIVTTFIGDNELLALTGGAVLNDSGGLAVGNTAAGTLTIANGGSASTAYAILGNASGISGSATLSGAGARWAIDDTLTVASLGTANLLVQNGATASADTLIEAASNGVVGSVVVDDAASALVASQSAIIGYAGTAALSVENRATFSDGGLAELGALAGSQGTATVTGQGSTWQIGAALVIGDGGTGSVGLLADSRIEAQNVTLGYLAGGVGALTISGAGSTVSATQSANIGETGSGTLVITNAGTLVIRVSGQLGASAGSMGVASISGSLSLWRDAGPLTVGAAGAATLTLSSGGRASALDLSVASVAGSSGTITLFGIGTALNISQGADIGYAAAALLSLADGATMTTGAAAQIGDIAGASGTVTIDGIGTIWRIAQRLAVGTGGSGVVVLSNRAKLSLGDDLAVGIDYSAPTATGVVQINSGAKLTSALAEIGYSAGSSGTVTVTGTGSLLSVAQTLYVGGYWGGAGGIGQLNLSESGTVDAIAAVIWSSGDVALSKGALLTSSATIEGTLSGNGLLTASSSVVGAQIVNGGELAATGGTLTVAGDITGTGFLTIAAGAELLLRGPVAATQQLAFAASGAPGTLALGTAWQTSASLTNFASGDAIELLGVVGSLLQYNNGTLTVIGAGGPDDSFRALATLAFEGSYSINSFTLGLDSSGDTFIYATPSSPGGSGGGGVNEAIYLETHRFFANSSPWNTPIGTNQTYTIVPGLSSYVGGLSSWTGGSVAIYYATTSDPLVPVLYNANTYSNLVTGDWLQSGNSASVEQAILATSSSTNPVPGNPYVTQTAGLTWNSTPSGLPSSFDAWDQMPGQTLYAYIPANALPPPNSDGGTAIIQPDGWALELYAPVVLSTGQWVSMMYSETNALGGLGVGSEDGRRASMIESYAGALRDTDVTSGTIDHALALILPGSLLTAAYTGPALSFDASVSEDSGTLPYGALLALPASLNLASLGLESSFGLELADAAQEYGMYVVDRGGSGVTLLTQNDPSSSVLSTYSGTLQHDLNVIVQHAQLVG